MNTGAPCRVAHENAVRLARLLSIVLALAMFRNMLSPAFWIWTADNSVIGVVTRLASYPAAMPWVWLVLAASVVPFAASQLWGGDCLICTRIAVWGLMGGSCMWMFYAWLGRNLDYAWLVLPFGFSAAVCLCMSFVLASSINDDQKLDAKACHEA